MDSRRDNSKDDRLRALTTVTALDRQALERKVEEGTKKAVEQYAEVFERLAEYDRT